MQSRAHKQTQIQHGLVFYSHLKKKHEFMHNLKWTTQEGRRGKREIPMAAEITQKKVRAD